MEDVLVGSDGHLGGGGAALTVVYLLNHGDDITHVMSTHMKPVTTRNSTGNGDVAPCWPLQRIQAQVLLWFSH